MTKTRLQALVERLNPVCRKALEKAAELCVRHTNYNVEVEHLLRALLELAESDLHILLRYYEIEEADLQSELTAAIESFQRGSSRTPSLSPEILDLLEQSWSISSLHLAEGRVRTGGMILALLQEPGLRGHIAESVPSLLRIPRDHLSENLAELVADSPERTAAGGPGGTPPSVKTPGEGTPSRPTSPSAPAPGSGGAGPDVSAPGGEGALERFTVDLTREAREGRIDPVRARDDEIRQIIDILMRRRQNNPILTGDAGVGKTAVVEGFALRIAAGEVPAPLQDASVHILDLGLLQAGAGVKGEFERRLKSVIEEVKASPKPLILFIDEAHTIIGAGGSEGKGDAANLLKPVLARGELQTIAATTWSEYKKYVEKDPALARRFQVVKVEEPTPEAAMDMLRGVAAHLEGHHGVRILDEAVEEAVSLSHRYISGRRLPDKAVSLLDTAAARVAMGHTAVPHRVEALRRRVDRLTLELDILEREEMTGAEHGDRAARLRRELESAREALEGVEEEWRSEREVVERIGKLHAASEEAREKGLGPRDIPEIRRQLQGLEAELAHLQGEEPLVPLEVDAQVVASVIADWTGIPAGKMVRDEIRTVLKLERRLQTRIIGQPQALDVICRRIGTSSAGLQDPSRPTGVFLLVGSSGVGKTETAVALAECLFGGEQNMITVNMSEYQEPHTVSSLKGAPPGYVGHGKGGVLTEAVRRRPYSVVLLDEVEKAHPDVLEVFYQVFDKGAMEDGDGQLIDFKNTIILLTSNLGSQAILEECEDGGRPDAGSLLTRIRPHLLRRFSPAFLGRLTVVPYYPLRDGDIEEIAGLKLSLIQRRFWEQHGAELTYGEEVLSLIAARCTEVDSGARNVDHIITQTMLPELSVRVLDEMAQGHQVEAAHVDVGPDSLFEYRIRGGPAPT